MVLELWLLLQRVSSFYTLQVCALLRLNMLAMAIPTLPYYLVILLWREALTNQWAPSEGAIHPNMKRNQYPATCPREAKQSPFGKPLLWSPQARAYNAVELQEGLSELRSNMDPCLTNQCPWMRFFFKKRNLRIWTL